jgi:hypothetical protein
MKLDRRPIGHFTHPHIKIFSFARLEEEQIVAVVQLGELVELVELRLGVELGFFLAVRK